ncbi:MAG: HAD-IA family hydrolase [Lachnospiraceae bacterium]|nr:HAD-IA family hydrolase [Lachnospiraceae bacterium]
MNININPKSAANSISNSAQNPVTNPISNSASNPAAAASEPFLASAPSKERSGCPYACCIFDLDGTIINTIHALTYTTNLVMAEFGLGPLSEAQLKKIVGDGYKMQMERSLIACGDSRLVHFQESLPLYQKLFRENCLYQLEPYEGMKELLDLMKAAGMKLAVFTNKPHERGVENVEAVYGKGYFDYILGEQEGMPKKPDPEGAFRVMKALGVEPSECLYMGDTNTDMRTAANAGLDAVGAAWGFRGREELEQFHPKFLADHPLDVADWLGLR